MTPDEISAALALRWRAADALDARAAHVARLIHEAEARALDAAGCGPAGDAVALIVAASMLRGLAASGDVSEHVRPTVARIAETIGTAAASLPGLPDELRARYGGR